jgi:hypothetical protein
VFLWPPLKYRYVPVEMAIKAITHIINNLDFFFFGSFISSGWEVIVHLLLLHISVSGISRKKHRDASSAFIPIDSAIIS